MCCSIQGYYGTREGYKSALTFWPSKYDKCGIFSKIDLATYKTRALRHLTWVAMGVQVSFPYSRLELKDNCLEKSNFVIDLLQLPKYYLHKLMKLL